MNNNICIISGPTATGKTDVSIALAKKFDGEIVNFDSLLFYQELQIGTARPTLSEMNGVVHHLIGNHSIKSPINAAVFKDMAEPIVLDIHSRGKTAFLVGGSGFYLQALIQGMYSSTTSPKEIEERSKKLYQLEGISPFLKILSANDPKSHELYHENDHYRVRRAVEHFWTTGRPFSESRSLMQQNSPDAPWKKHHWNLLHCYLDIPKDIHENIIRKRAIKMLDQGLISEVKNILSLGFNGQERPLQSIGYKETQEYLNGKITSKEELIEKITIATRQLAKAQRTWFKKQEKISYNSLEQREELFSNIELFLCPGKANDTRAKKEP